MRESVGGQLAPSSLLRVEEKELTTSPRCQPFDDIDHFVYS